VKRKIRYAADFARGLDAQLTWLASQGETAWIERLREGLDEAAILLSRHPQAGPLEESEGGSDLRRLVLRRVPYVIWYATLKGPRGEVWILRLFHARQRRPKPSWPAGPRKAKARTTERTR